MENQGSAVAANAGPAGVWLPEVEAQDTGVTQGRLHKALRRLGRGGDEVIEKALLSFIL